MESQFKKDTGINPWQFVLPQHWHSWVGLGILRLVVLLPLPVIWLMGVVIGEGIYWLFPSRRHIAMTNLKLCFPELSDKQRKKLLRKNFYATGQGIFDAGIAWWASSERLCRLTKLTNRHHYDKAIEQGKPIVLLAGHFVALDIGGMLLSSERPFASIYKKPRNKLLHYFMVRGREHFGQMTLVETRDNVKLILRTLKNKQPFYFPGDQDFGRKRSVFVKFFNTSAATVPTLGRLAKLADAVVIPCFTFQLPRGRGYEVVFKGPLKNFPSGDVEQDAARMNQVIEEAVRTKPEQYFWVHRRFKTQPDKTKADLYKD